MNVQVPQKPTQKPKVAIVGGGIAGLTAAKRMADAGYEVHLFEDKGRVGGKIQTVDLGGVPADDAAEFIDTDHVALHQLAGELKDPKTGQPLVEVVEAMDNLSVRHALSDGRILTDEEFWNAYKPIADIVKQHKLAIVAEPDGALAKQLDGISAKEYVTKIAEDLNKEQKRTWWQWSTGQQATPVVKPEIVEAALSYIASENATPPENTSALEFVHEASGKDTGDMMATDAKFRVKGGTQVLINALESDLASKGVVFHTQTPVTAIAKAQGKYQLQAVPKGEQAEGGVPPVPEFDQVVMALPAHSLAKIQGLQNVGFSQEDIQMLAEAHYASYTKYTVRTKVPVQLDGFFLSDQPYQTWNRVSEDGKHSEVVFLAGKELAEKYSPKELQAFMMADYAQKHSTTPEALFDPSVSRYNWANPEWPCLTKSAPGQFLQKQQLAARLEQLATTQGIAVVGNFIPRNIAGQRTTGYMINGVEASNRALLNLKAQLQSQELGQAMTQQLAQSQGAGMPPLSRNGWEMGS